MTISYRTQISLS
uniref:Uncharacterized protein n=1 Tax=Rhizophora mucronata TaxID=61149 RepID=A0A2P2NRR2_RHIMU